MLNTKENLQGKVDEAADKAKGWSQEARATAGGIAEPPKDQEQAATAGARELAGTAKHTAQEWASSAGGAAVQAKDKVRDVASAAVEKAGEVGQNLTALIRRHPLKAVLAGVGVGFAVGFLVIHLLRRS